MTTKQMDLFRQSWNRLSPVARSANALFLWRFSDLVPAYRPLVSSHGRDRESNLLLLIGHAVDGLTNPGRPEPESAPDLHHSSYEMLEHHSQAAAEALYWTLEKALGASFTPDVKQAWSAAYNILCSRLVHEA